jgi:hypothetical protein
MSVSAEDRRLMTDDWFLKLTLDDRRLTTDP